MAISSTKICDEDRDTCFETERSTDEDIVRAKAGGQDIFEGYSSGIFSLVKQSAVKLRKTTVQTISNLTETKIQFNVVDVDVQNEWNTTNYRFTCTKTGYYLICASIVYINSSWSSGDFANLSVYKNGVAHLKLDREQVDYDITRYLKLRGAAIIYLNAGDYIEIYTIHDRGADTDIYASSTENYCTIGKIA